jgi:glycosyltransferase involved in cell wall biosynthesis
VESLQSLRLCLVISSLGPGGAERVLSQLANHWAALGWHVTFLIFADPAMPIYYPLHPNVIVRQLDLMRPSKNLGAALFSNIWRLIRLRAAIRECRANVVLSFIDQSNILTLLATRGLGLPVAVSERVDPTQHPGRRIWQALRILLYPFAAAVVVQTAGIAAHFPAIIRRRIVVLPNMISAPLEKASGKAKCVVGAVGRLERQKGFDFLIHAFVSLSSRHPEWTLMIWGEGRERQALQKQIDVAGLGSRIQLKGITERPSDWVKETTIFVLSSRYEGFPNALGEAMAAGLPVVAFDCPSGPREMIDKGGLLVPPQDAMALAEALDRIMCDEALRTELGNAAVTDVARFSPQIVLEDWTKLMRRLSNMEVVQD